MSDVEEEDWRSHLVRNWLDTETLDTIGVMLSTGDNGYETLGSKLGYRPLEIAAFKVSSSHSGRSPGRCLLEDWQRREKTTVLVLLVHLQQMGRDDIVKFLETEARDCTLIIVIDKQLHCPKVNRSQTMRKVIDDLVARDDQLRLQVRDRRLEPVHEAGDIWNRKAEQCMGSQHDFNSARIKRSQTTKVRKQKYEDSQPRNAKSHNIAIDQRKALRVSGPQEVFAPILPPIRDSLQRDPNFHECPVDPDFHEECGAVGDSVIGESWPQAMEQHMASAAAPLLTRCCAQQQLRSTENEGATDLSVNLSLRSDGASQRHAEENRSGSQPDRSESETLIGEAQLRSKDHLSAGGVTLQGTRRQGCTDMQLAQGVQSMSLDSQVTVARDDRVTTWDALHMGSFTSGAGLATGGTESVRLYASTQDSARQLPGYRADATGNNQIQKIFALYSGRDGAYILRPSRTVAGALSISVIHRYDPPDHGIDSFRVQEMPCQVNGRQEIRYYLFDNGPIFHSLKDLIKHYHVNAMQQPGAATSGPKLRQPLDN